jgi:hypothetical protein
MCVCVCVCVCSTTHIILSLFNLEEACCTVLHFYSRRNSHTAVYDRLLKLDNNTAADIMG